MVANRERSKMRSIKNGLTIILLILLSLPLFMIGTQGNLGINDEACYALVAKEMVKSGDWLTPHRWGKPFYEKPPLLFWIIAIFFKVFGIGNVVSRLPGVLFGIGVIIFTYMLSREVCEEQDGNYPLYSYFILLITPPMVVYVHGALMDIPLLFFLLMGTYFLIKSERIPHLAIFFGVSLGLGIMMKGPMALVLIFGFIPYIILKKKWQYFTNLYLYLGLILMFIIILPWHIYEIVKNGESFIRDYFGFHIFKRMSSPVASTVVNTATGIFFYPVIILMNFLPWSVFLLQSLWRDIKNMKISHRSTLIISWTVTNLVILTLIRTRLDQYTIIFYPFLALSVGAYLPGLVEKAQDTAQTSLLIGSIIYLVLSIILIVASFVVFFKFTQYILYVIPALIVASILLTFSFIYFFRSKLVWWRNWILRILIGGFYSGWIVSLIFVPFWEYSPDFMSFISLVSRMVPVQEKIYAAIPYRNLRILYMRDPLHFYLDNPIEDVDEDYVKEAWDTHDSLIFVVHKIIYKENFSILSRGAILFESKEWLLIKKEKK